MGWMDLGLFSSARGVLVIEPTTWTLLVAGKKPQWRQVTVEQNTDFSLNWSRLTNNNLNIKQLTLVVPNHYVIFDNCDPPTLALPEWKQSLPFLLMDQLAMDVADMVIFPWSTASLQWQVAVMTRLQLQTWCTELSKKNIQLERVIPSALAWGVTQKETTGLVLQDQSGWSLLIYCDEVLCFQRRLRGIEVGKDTSTTLSQLTGELQRTLIFLRGNPQYPEPIQWFSATELQNNYDICPLISAVFGVPCTIFSDSPDWSLSMSLGWRLLQSPAFTQGFTAQDWQILPSRFSRTSMAMVVAGIVSIALLGMTYHQTSVLSESITKQKATNSGLMTQLTTEKLSPDQQKLTQLTTGIAQKERDWRSLEKLAQLNPLGFSHWLQAFGDSMTGEIQLTSFTLKDNFIELKGLAKNSAAVPRWITEFSKFPILATPQFDSLLVSRDLDDQLKFVLRSVEGKS
jgi:Tfp pilus assembly protein PilN